MNDIQKVIHDTGGVKKFCHQYKIPRRTAQDWQAGRRTPPEWVSRLIKQQKETKLAEGANNG